MARKSNFDDTQLQAAMAGLRREWPKKGMEAYRLIAKAFIETAKKKTKLAKEGPKKAPKKAPKRKSKTIRGSYQHTGIAYRQAGGDRQKANREIEKRVKAIGYMRQGWKIRRIDFMRKIIHVVNDAENSRYVKNAWRAMQTAKRLVNKSIAPVMQQKLQPVAKRYSAK